MSSFVTGIVTWHHLKIVWPPVVGEVDCYDFGCDLTTDDDGPTILITIRCDSPFTATALVRLWSGSIPESAEPRAKLSKTIELQLLALHAINRVCENRKVRSLNRLNLERTSAHVSVCRLSMVVARGARCMASQSARRGTNQNDSQIIALFIPLQQWIACWSAFSLWHPPNQHRSTFGKQFTAA